MLSRLRACLLSLLLLEPTSAWRLSAALAGSAFAVEALAQTRSSGGYSRPGSGGGRTPSFGGPRVAPRTPSTSGGYARPTPSAPGYQRRPSVEAPSGGGSARDRAYSRESSAAALNRMREQQDAARREAQRPTDPRVADPRGAAPQADPGWWRRGGTLDRGYGGGFGGGYPSGRTGGWYGDRGWSPPAYPTGGQRGFGIWDGLFLGFLLNNLTRSGSTDFFHNHRDDPGYREWRAEAERQARDNAELRQRLEELDRRLAERQGQPRDPNYLPPDVPPEVALAPRDDARTPSTGAAEASGSGGALIWVVLGGAGLLGFLAWRRRQVRRTEGGGTMGGGGTVSTAASAAAMLRHKVAGEGYTPQRFRVGMTVTCDPTPFLLAGGTIKVPVPATGEDNALVSVQAVGRIGEGEAQLVHLYLPDDRSLFQLHLDAAGEPDECRFFAVIDEVTPADEAEWGAWLEPQQGMIGWPEFQTRDGKLYARVWAPGSSWVLPRALVETIETLRGTRQVRSQAMLYAASTGAPAPAPETEYILVAALEEGGRAWVEVRAGIDVNPASLSLA